MAVRQRATAQTRNALPKPPSETTFQSAEVPVKARDTGERNFESPEFVPARAATNQYTEA
eukprot:1589820-Pleurochrysis_carterae.AAC.2